MTQAKESITHLVQTARRRPLETANRILESRLENVDSVERTTLEVAERAGFHGNELEKIGLAVREVVANAIIHGNRLDCEKKVVVTILRTSKQLEVAVWDQGRGFDMQSVSDPRTPDALLMPSGRGVYLARAFMDEFHVQAGSANGTTVTLIKYIRAGGPRPALGLALAS